MPKQYRKLNAGWCVMFLLVASLAWADPEIQFTRQELDFIEAHREVRIGIDPSFVPFEFITSDGIHGGISSDVLALVASRTGLDFVYNPELKWVDAVQGARDRTIDLLPTVGYTAARAQYVTYLEPYLHFQRSIVVPKGNMSITSFSDLSGRQVAVQRDSSHEGFLSAYPEVSLRLYDTVEEGLLAVTRGDEIAFIGNEATNAYLSREMGLTGLKFIVISEGGVQDLHMAVRNDWPVLARILQKALDSITDAEYAAILGKWISYESSIDYTPVIRIAIMIAILVLIILVISFFWIIRLRKAVREKDHAQREAQTADMEKSRFMARISHEIRTPLNGIRGMAYLLEKTTLDPTQTRYVHAIQGTSQTMQSIINDILEYSRLDEGRVVLESIPFSLDDVLQNCISMESWSIKQKGLELRLNLEDSIPQFLQGDPTRLTQIVANLFHNAVKFTSEGVIELSVSSHVLDQDKCLLDLQVRDTGIGMDEEQLRSIFTPFVQANESINRKYGGSGLGLSIVKSLVERMGGTIHVESKPGKGSTFKVTLPLMIDHQRTEADKSQRSMVDFSGMKILLVLHEGLLINRVNTLFDRYHIKHDEVSSMSIASNLIRSGSGYDVIVVELDDRANLPTEFLDTLATLGDARPKLLMLSHNEVPAEIGQGKLTNQDLILPLPIVNSVLYNALLELSGKGQPRADTRIAKMEPIGRIPLNVLVVEDNQINQIIVKELLEHAGCTVLLANNGKEGYETFLDKEAMVDIILMDLHMEVMDGYESTSLIRQRNREVPILVLSADLMDSVRRKCEELGVNDIIGKPYDPEFLITKVFEMGQSYQRPGRMLGAIDTERGLKQMGGDRQMFNLVLASFITETEQLVADLRETLAKGNYVHAAELVHKCKGSCGSIGAIKAQQLCIKLQPQLSTKDVRLDQGLMESLFLELDRVLVDASRYRSL